jgi:hypothetical protein
MLKRLFNLKKILSLISIYLVLLFLTRNPFLSLLAVPLEIIFAVSTSLSAPLSISSKLLVMFFSWAICFGVPVYFVLEKYVNHQEDSLGLKIYKAMACGVFFGLGMVAYTVGHQYMLKRKDLE